MAALTNELQLRAMQTTSLPSRRHSGSAGFLYRDTGQGRTTKNVDSPAVTCVN